MDFISCKIEFANIQLARRNSTLEEFEFSTGYSVVLDLDADIEILINDMCIFCCSMVPILELYLQLKKWNDAIYIDNFSYRSLESSTPIFELENNENNWYFISNFIKEKVRIKIDILCFKKAVHNFLKAFEKHFKKIFDIDVVVLLNSFL